MSDGRDDDPIDVDADDPVADDPDEGVETAEETEPATTAPAAEGKAKSGAPARPGKDRASRHQHALQYGWWAYNSGEKKTARYYGWKAIGAKPWSSKGWKLVLVATIK